MSGWRLGVLGGSGLYDIDGLEDVSTQHVDTPWGAPSDKLVFGRLNGVELVFLPRHGVGHHTPPSEINYRANIDALKRSGCTDVLSLSACGSFKEELPPGAFVVVDQFVDRTRQRPQSFFAKGCAAHVSLAHPVCARLAGLAAEAGRRAGAPVTQGGTYLAMEGPQFSTQAESNLYRAWGMDVVGMTNMPEARLAREAELPFATVAMVTDYDCWHPDHDHVEVATVIKHLTENAATAKRLLAELTAMLGETPRTPSPQGIETCLDTALITAPEARDPELLKKLDAVAGRALNA